MLTHLGGMVKVTNRSTQTFRDMYDGVPLELAPKESKLIPVIMARHIFGYGEVPPRRALMRLGWLQTDDERPGVRGGWVEAMDRLREFQFTAQKMVDDDGDSGDVSTGGKKAAA